MKRLLVSFLLLLLIILAVFGGKCFQPTDMEQNDQADSDTVGYAASVPQPAADSFVEDGCGILYSSISSKGMDEYLSLLIQDGWKDYEGKELSLSVPQGITSYMLTKENNLLQIMMLHRSKDYPLNNSILVRLDQKVSMELVGNRKKALTKDDAIKIIQPIADEAVKEGKIPSAKGRITGVFEIFIKDAYDRLQLQAYAAYSDISFSGCYLIRKGICQYVPGNLSSACVADIDQDGSDELMDLCTSWSNGIYKTELFAYQYITPIYFSSLTEILQTKYYNCIVPDNGYEEMSLSKIDDTKVILSGKDAEYGKLYEEGTVLKVESTKKLPFREWSEAYDQSQLKDFDKVIPEKPPEVTISIEGLDLDYIVLEDDWDGKEENLTSYNMFDQISKKKQFIPTFRVGYGGEEDSKSVGIDFGSSIPDSVQVYDEMLDTDGRVCYNLTLEQTVKIINTSKVEFPLVQHMAYMLSSNSGTYEMDWLRLFRVVCKWGTNKCTYAFLINTGKTEKLTQ